MTDGKGYGNNLIVVPFVSREIAELAIVELIAQRQEIALVVVDTSTVYFEGDDENANKDALAHAKWLRSISTRLPGNPTILICCHPIKNASHNPNPTGRPHQWSNAGVRSVADVATKREAHRTPRSDREGQLQRWGR